MDAGSCAEETCQLLDVARSALSAAAIRRRKTRVCRKEPQPAMSTARASCLDGGATRDAGGGSRAGRRCWRRGPVG